MDSAEWERQLLTQANAGMRFTSTTLTGAAIEIKRGPSAKLQRGIHQAHEDLKPDRAFAVHAGDDRYPIGNGIKAIGIRELAGELEAEFS